MHSTASFAPRISAPQAGGQIAPGPVNYCCHTWTGGVQQQSRHVIRIPRVQLILWGDYQSRAAGSDYIAYAYEMVLDLVTGAYMNKLCQYGVAPGSIVGTGTFDTGALDPPPGTLDQDGVLSKLKQWLSTPGGLPQPSVNEASLVYLILPPTATQLTIPGPNGVILQGGTDFGGYHYSGKYNEQSANDDLFLGIVSTKHADQSTPRAFMSSICTAVSHELVELFTDRDGQGYVSGSCQNPDGSAITCEIGDICEQHVYSYRRSASSPRWPVQQYWSGWDNGCVHGESPVSVKKFLTEIGFDYQIHPLSVLGTSTISIPYIASRM